jgi:hypothetical protein
VSIPFARVKLVGIVGAVMLGLGTLLPWLVATDQALGVTVTRPGIDAGSEGLTILVFAFVSGIALYVATRTAAFVAAGAALLAVLLAIRDLNPSPDLIAYLGLPGEASIGFGLYVSMVGAAIVFLVAAYGTRALRDT